MFDDAAATYRPAWPDPLSLSRDELAELDMILPGVVVLPVLHGRIECAQMVRRAIEKFSPAAIAVELPAGIGEPLARAIARLPLLSALEVPNEAQHGRPQYLVVEPADPLIEAVRRATELGIPFHLVDREVADYPSARDHLPDVASAESVGAAAWLRAALAAASCSPRAAADDPREDFMAGSVAALALRQNLPDATVLVVCGLHHARGLVARLGPLLAEGAAPPAPLRRLTRREGHVLWHLSEQSSAEVLGEPAFIQAAYERSRGSAPPSALSPASAGAVLDLFTRARQAPIQDPFRTPSPPDPHDDRPRVTGRTGLLLAICQQARTRYRERTGGDLRPGAILRLLRYAHAYALEEGAIAPDLYQLVVAARGFVDDTYAQEVWEVATAYPWQAVRPELPPLDLSLRDLHDRVRTIHFHPKLMQRRRRLMKIVRPREKERRKGEWAERFTGDSICSYPPEDLALEHYGAFLRKRTERVLSDAHTQVAPFSTSLFDGVDVRETVRNWHQGKIYVRIEQLVRGKPGAVVVIFDDEPLVPEDDDEAEPKFGWHMTWQGEHEDEGDMALYASDPFAQVVGPGIGRALYGGFLLNRPPGQMFGVWEDPHFGEARTKAEVLLRAALDYSAERLVVYVAAAPPRPALRQLAQRMDKKIVYVPLGQLSPVALKRLRVFHVLSDRNVRAVAHRYIRD
ncbi:hypothetical protein [Nannocystis pusilla]|uniref:hypothetical protein n=1 Tax=Nannocystis pusilla TaxID=889268 RepID=UPI003BF25DA2